MANPVIVAERVGFEPTKSLSALTPLAGERLQPDSATSPRRTDVTGGQGGWERPQYAARRRDGRADDCDGLENR